MQAHLLEDIGKAVISAGAIGVPAYYFKIPLILAYMIAGILIGPIGLGLIQDHESISGISEIGLVLLMFILGLEINLKKLFQTGKTVLWAGSLQIGGSVLIASLIGYFLYPEMRGFPLVYFSISLALSSTLIIVKILSDKMDLDSLPSRITLGILILQDFCVVAFLAIQPNLENVNLLAIGVSFTRIFSLVMISWILAKFFLPNLFKIVSKNSELLLIVAMAWCFSMCAFANTLKLSLEMGALIAGISIASFPHHIDVAAKIISLRDFFITLFFVSLGLQIPMPTWDVVKLSLVISFLVLLTRIITLFPTLHKSGDGIRVSLFTTINLAQISEFSLVLISLGISYGHVSHDLLVSFIFALILTALISSFLIPRSHELFNKLSPYFEMIGIKEKIANTVPQESSHEHESSIFLLGFYKDTSSLLYELETYYPQSIVDQLSVIDFNPEANQKLKLKNIRCHFGDISNLETLKMLQIDKAKLIICTIPDRVLKGTTNLLLLKHLKTFAPEAKIILSTENLSNAEELYAQGANYVYIPRIIGAKSLAQTILSLLQGDDEQKEKEFQEIKERNEVLV